MDYLATQLAEELNHPAGPVANALRLLDEDNTIPFIARYRKELTASMDEVALRTLRDRAGTLRLLDERRATVLASIGEQGKLTPGLEADIARAATRQELEDLYLPFRPKRRTRGSMAREQGLEPLALAIFRTGMSDAAAEQAVRDFLKNSAGGLDEDAVWSGCRDLLAEMVADDPPGRAWIRERTWHQGSLTSVVAKEYLHKKTKFKDYYDYSEPLRRIPAHRYLALRRGESEKVLRVGVSAPVEDILTRLAAQWCPQARGRVGEHWELIVSDAYKRLIAPGVEGELRARLKEAADADSIAIFTENLANLLLLPPGGEKVVLGLDPGFRSGSKWAVVDATGRLLGFGTIYPLPPQNQAGEAARAIADASAKHRVEVIAVGNGTASRELMTFLSGAIAGLKPRPAAVLVNEDGASVYSASELAREEFPDLDLTVRGAVSIARRWQDPLAELVKIDPKSIGVGQYQHDVQQNLLRKALDETVESCVNKVGVNVNSASWALLRYVAGVGPALAREIVIQREDRGPFSSRGDLETVPRMGPMAFRQCAGFLLIRDGGQPLDASAVHPEQYGVVERMAAGLGVPLADLVGNPQAAQRIDLEPFIAAGVGRPTLEDIVSELSKPGRDPREGAEAVRFSEEVTEIGHLRPGMRLEGIVTNITHFGAFVDVGVHHDGLVHISQLADRFVKSPGEVVKVGQPVQVSVLAVDTELGRISLSMKKNPSPPRARTE